MPDQLATMIWIERVRAADAEAEQAWRLACEDEGRADHEVVNALMAIAAELRAQRIARRPGAGQS